MRSRLYFFAMLLAALVTSAVAAPSAAASVERASIIPVINQFLGPAVNNVGGYSIYANGITDYWSTASPGSVTFAIFVYPGKQVTQDLTFTMMPPSGSKAVYAYTFKAQPISVVGSWFTVTATGDYSNPGTYSAIVTADGQEIGRIPVVFATASPAP